MRRAFGSQDDNEGAARATHSDSHHHAQQPPDEHTRLLPSRIDTVRAQDLGYLSPDDPAVSPYNLFTVRFSRYLTIFFTLISFVWWVLQLVSIFVSPPGLSTRGSPFLAFSYSSIAASTLIVTLLFFAAPSKAARLLSAVASALFLVSLIIMLSVRNIRHEEAWAGLASAIWALLMSVWALSSDRIVKWAKKEEEERLTGREESRRTLLEWAQVVLATIAFALLAVAALLLTLTLIMRALDAKLPPLGELYWVDGDKYQIHLYCRGTKTDSAGKKLSTVLLEAGEDPVEHGLWQIADKALENGSINRYCFADRPGMAWSDTAPSPFSASQATEALSEALVRAGETGPWILASAGIGSIYSRVFSSRHGNDIKGLLFIDPLHEDLLYRVGSPARGFVLWLRGVISPLGLDRIPAALFRGRTSDDRVYGRASYQSGKHIFAKLQESLVADTLTKRDVISSRAIQAPGVPLFLITSATHLRTDSQWEAKQRDLSHLTGNLQAWDIVDDAPHQVWKTPHGRDLIEKRISQLVQG